MKKNERQKSNIQIPLNPEEKPDDRQFLKELNEFQAAVLKNEFNGLGAGPAVKKAARIGFRTYKATLEGEGIVMTRAEHLRWAKDRALEYIEAGDLSNAFGSMVSDLQKHPETEGHAGILLGTQLRMRGHLDTPEKMRNFIEGFN